MWPSGLGYFTIFLQAYVRSHEEVLITRGCGLCDKEWLWRLEGGSQSLSGKRVKARAGRESKPEREDGDRGWGGVHGEVNTNV